MQSCQSSAGSKSSAANLAVKKIPKNSLVTPRTRAARPVKKRRTATSLRVPAQGKKKGSRTSLDTKKMRLILKAKKSQQVADVIEETHGDKFRKKPVSYVHGTPVLVGKEEVEVPPDKKMSKDRSLVRHIATALLETNKEMVEVQVAISHKDEKIYIASNTKEKQLGKIISRSKSLKRLKFSPYSGNDKRIMGHINKLKNEIEGEYKHYKIELIKGEDGKHAEAKIVDAGVHFDRIEGTRRPCVNCSLHFQTHNVDPNTFNQHPGGYWNTNKSRLSLVDHVKEIKKTRYGGRFYKNKGRSDKRSIEIGTDSEDEYAGLTSRQKKKQKLQQ
jgi:hypothetical protein